MFLVFLCNSGRQADVTPDALQMRCWPMRDGKGDGGKRWGIGLCYPHLVGETQRKHCFTSLLFVAVVLIRWSRQINADACGHEIKNIECHHPYSSIYTDAVRGD